MSANRTWGAAVLTAVLLATAATATTEDATDYGEELKLEETVSVSELLAEPDPWVGKLVRVEGKITDVCPKMGCWIDIEDRESGSIRFKVKDGIIVFPVEAKGKNVIAEGVFERMELTEEQAVAHARHEAEEKNEEFDPSSVKPPFVYYRLQGKGAQIR